MQDSAPFKTLSELEAQPLAGPAHAALMTWMAVIAAPTAQEKQQLLATVVLPVEGAQWDMPLLPQRPGRPAHWRVSEAPPRRRRTLAHGPTRNRFLLAIHNIELSAIDLAVVACLRGSGAPSAFHRDFMRIARDEARHALLMEEELQRRQLSPGIEAVHYRLWETTRACVDLGEHLVAIPRFLEARGLDVAADVLPRLALVDPPAHDALSIIYHDEMTHVDIGTRWHHWWCAQQGLDPVEHFQSVVTRHFPGQVPGPTPLDHVGRAAAGFVSAEITWRGVGNEATRPSRAMKSP
jgi:uncharacterized ferritin-like protein (DUF455 family)